MSEILFYEEPERQIKYQQTDLYEKGNFLDKVTFSFVKPQVKVFIIYVSVGELQKLGLCILETE